VILRFAAVTVGLLLFACSHAPSTPQAHLTHGAAQMREAITAAIAEPARRAQLLERADQYELVLQRYSGDFGEFEQAPTPIATRRRRRSGRCSRNSSRSGRPPALP
jgi:hypothetical protein